MHSQVLCACTECVEVRERSEPAAGAPSAECFADLHVDNDLRRGHRRLRPSSGGASAGLARTATRTDFCEGYSFLCASLHIREADPSYAKRFLILDLVPVFVDRSPEAPALMLRPAAGESGGLLEIGRAAC